MVAWPNRGQVAPNFWDGILKAYIDAAASPESVLKSVSQIKQWAKMPDSIITGSITRNVDGVVTSASVLWPDGGTGTFTTTSIGPLNTIDSYTVTYVKGSTSLTFTQPAITRDGNGAATNVPDMTVVA